MSAHLKLKHEDVDVYRAAMDFLALAARLLEEVPRGHGAWPNSCDEPRCPSP
jgi:hypothetical protein